MPCSVVAISCGEADAVTTDGRSKRAFLFEQTKMGVAKGLQAEEKHQTGTGDEPSCDGFVGTEWRNGLLLDTLDL